MFGYPWYIYLIAISVTYTLISVVFFRRKRLDVKNKHVLITGGSLGIGKSMAIDFSLDEAKAELEKERKNPSQKVYAVAVNDVADVTKYDSIHVAVSKAELQSGPVDLCVCNAGMSIPGYFVEQKPEVFEQTMNVNYLGTAFTCKAVVPSMMRRKQGHIAIVSSPAGMTGFIGFTSYSPSKFAQRGFAEALNNELYGFNIGVSIVYPSDTDTPGFAEENKTKPAETKILSDVGTLQTAESVAKQAVDGIVARKHHIGTDFISKILIIGNNGFFQRDYPILEALAAPLLSLIQSIFVVYFNMTAKGLNKRQLKLD